MMTPKFPDLQMSRSDLTQWLSTAMIGSSNARYGDMPYFTR